MAEFKNDLNQPIGYPMLDWNARSHPPKTVMQGRYCQVEPLNIDIHAKSLYESLAANPTSADWTYLPYGPFEQFDDFKQWLEQTCIHDDPLFHAITEVGTSKAVGLASYLRIEPGVGVVEVGHIHFSPLLQRTPMATEAMFLMMKRVFDELGYRRYEWKCDSLNARSRNAALRFGFTFEGIFRQVTIYKNRSRDTAWFSIIDTEWPALKTAYETWLSPDNFDDEGNQVKSFRELVKEREFKTTE